MNYDALDAELSQPEYQSLSDADAASCIMSKTVLTRSAVNAELIQETASLNGLWGTLKIASLDSNLTDPPRGIAIAFIDWVESNRSMNFDTPAVRSMADLLIHHGLATQGQIDNLDALADTTARWVDINGIGEVGIGLVINSRKRIAQRA